MTHVRCNLGMVSIRCTMCVGMQSHDGLGIYSHDSGLIESKYGMEQNRQVDH